MKVFNVEEFHRGEWQPLIIKKSTGEKIQKTVRITENHAERMNFYSEDYKIRYVLDEGVKKPKSKKRKTESVDSNIEEYSKLEASAIRDEYIELFGKKPYGGWSTSELVEKIDEFKSESK